MNDVNSNTSIIEKEDAKYLQGNSCDACDYLTAVACGAIGGLVDIFFVSTPEDSKLGKWTDQQVDNTVMAFARKMGWNPKEKNINNVNSAIGFLEQRFKVNYDQRLSTDVDNLFEILPKSHHMMSLAHSPDIIGLFFSVLNQFTSTSTFVAGGTLITISTKTFELQGTTFISKIFSGVVNWFGHLMSDVAGSSGSHGRGTGIVMPFYELFGFCKFGNFDNKTLAELAMQAFQQGYDFRFGITQAIPVILTDLIIRVVWSFRQHFQFKKALTDCVPNMSHENLRTMLLLGHGTLCLMDGADAVIRSGGNWMLFFMRMNLIAWVRFSALVLKEICIRIGIALPLQEELDAYKRLASYMQSYYEALKKIDLDRFKKETSEYNQWVSCMGRGGNEQQLNIVLRKTMIDLNIQLPWTGDFDSFMQDTSTHLVFQ